MRSLRYGKAHCLEYFYIHFRPPKQSVRPVDPAPLAVPIVWLGGEWGFRAEVGPTLGSMNLERDTTGHTVHIHAT